MSGNAYELRCSRPIWWLRHIIVITLTCELLLGVALAAGAVERKSGVAPNVISLPSGPGSIEGLGDAFEPNLNSGTASYRLAVELPPGRGGFTPELALEYNTGNPNGALGLGWQMNIPFVQRQTEKGLPHYTLWPDGDGLDNDKDGEVDDYDEFDTVIYSSKEEIVPVADGYWRLENESEFVRFRKVDNGWLATRRDGVALEFGGTGNSRVASDGRVFRWYLDRMVDLNGNIISFEYEKLDDSAQRYLKRIVYNQTDSAAMEVRFKYELRPDMIVDYRPRFELKTAYRCTEIMVLVGGELVRSYRLDYAPTTAWRPLSLLTSVTVLGRDGVSSLPSTRFGYTGANRSPPVPQLLNRAPIIGLNDTNVDLLDINADGLPDIIDTNRQPHVYYLNKGVDDDSQVLWASAAPMSNSVGLYLGATEVRFADMNGDGRTDLVNLFAQTAHYYSSGAALTWQRETPIRGARFAFTDSTVKLQDLDHDKRIDVIQSAGRELFAWMNQGGGVWSHRYTWTLEDAQLQLDRPTTLHADMNGDRLLDLVHAAPGVMYYYPSTGFGEFGKRVVMSKAPRRIIDPTRLLFADVNGDGRGDVVYLGNSLDVWLNQGLDKNDRTRGVLASPFSIQSPLFDAFVTCRQADINGNGSTDIIWNTTFNGRIQMAFVDFSPGAQPNLLNLVTNGIGGRTQLDYSSSVAEMVKDAAVGRPWSRTVPFPVPVVTKMQVDDGSNTYRTEFAYRDGYYDAEEKEFRGFAEVVKTDIGDETIPNLITSHLFDTGRGVEALKGKLLELETRDPEDKLFFREQHTWNTRTLARGVPGEARRITYAFQSIKHLDVYEGAQLPISAQWDYEYDEFGNLVRIFEHGRLDPGWQDERITETIYTSSSPDGLDSWILDRVVQQLTLDPDGNRIAAQRTYYDGNAALGLITAGNPSRIERWVHGSSWIDPERRDYDAFGNVTAIYDGEYHTRPEGRFREVSYDPEFTTYPVREIVHTGNAAAPRLEMRATYDTGFGEIISHTDFNGNLTTYAYDTFGRLIAVVKPGDSVAKPTEAYDYVLDIDAGGGVRVNWAETRRREQAGGGTLDSRIFYDGLGRKIMTREEDESPGRVVVTSAVQFNARGLLWRQYLPYFETGTLDFKIPPFSSEYMGRQYDALGRGIRLTQPDATFSTIEYEPFGKTVRDEEQTRVGSIHAGAALRFVVDGLQDEKEVGRLREVHEIVKLTNSGRQSSQPAEWKTSYDYDLLDNVVLITDAQGNRKRAFFDGLSRKVLDDDPNRGSMTYIYDAASNLRETIDAKRQRITYEYDGANRLVAENYHEVGASFSANRNPDVRYVYDRSAIEVELADGSRAAPRNTLGRLVSIYDLSGENHLSYDARGRIKWQVKGILNPRTGALQSYATAMEYDSVDRVTSLVYPDNHRMTYSYNTRGNLESIVSHGVSVVSNLAYISSGQLTHMDYGNGASTAYEYDDRLRLSRLTTSKPGESPLLSYTYRLDNVSNIVAIDDLRPRTGVFAGTSQRVNDQLFEYDDLYRLTQVRYGFKVGNDAAHISYRYDRIGNLLEMSSNIVHHEQGRTITNPGQFDYQGGRSERASRSSGDPPGPHATTGTGAFRVAYDDNGNMVQLGEFQLTWDFKDRLVGVKSDQMIAEYVYDHADRCVLKHISYSDGEPNASSVVRYVDQHYEIRNGMPVKYVYADQRRVARITDSLTLISGPDAPIPDSTLAVRYYHQDHLGSTNVVADASGASLEEIAYYPYGHPRLLHLQQSSGEPEPYKFSQKEFDGETGLQYFEARYFYGPLARFLSVDPVLKRNTQSPFEDPQRLNAYSYSLNRPLVYQDPSGEVAFLPLLLGGVSGVAAGYSIAKATGSSYGWKDAAVDFGLGMVSGPLISKGVSIIRKWRLLGRFAYQTKNGKKFHHALTRMKSRNISVGEINKVTGANRNGIISFYDMKEGSIVYTRFFSRKELIYKGAEFMNKIPGKSKGLWLTIAKDPATGKIKTLMWEGIKNKGKTSLHKADRFIPLP